MSSFRVRLFDIEFMSLSYTKAHIEIAFILYYSQKFIPHPFLGIATRLFVKINIS